MIWIIQSMYCEIFCRIASMFCWERTLLVSFLSKLCPETLKQELRLPSYVTKQKIHNIWNISKKQPTTYCLHFCLELKLYIRYSKKIFRSFPRLSVLRYKDKIEFKIFFAFVALYSIAWFNRLGPSNFYFIYLFFVPLNPP